MWDEQQRQRFQQLRQRQSQLTGEEQAELASLVQELEALESSYLTGATERLRQERETTEKQNRSLEDLAARRKALLHRLDGVLAEARAERHAISSELESVLTGTRDSQMDE